MAVLVNFESTEWNGVLEFERDTVGVRDWELVLESVDAGVESLGELRSANGNRTECETVDRATKTVISHGTCVMRGSRRHGIRMALAIQLATTK